MLQNPKLFEHQHISSKREFGMYLMSQNTSTLKTAQNALQVTWTGDVTRAQG